MAQTRTLDPYLILRARCLVRDVPKEIVPYLDTVRRASEWQALGFSAKLDEYGSPVRGSSNIHEFSIAREKDELIANAIRTGKKAVRHPLPVFEYVLAGCDLTEFADLPPDVEAFCQGNLLRINGRLEEALPLLEKAVHLNPDEVRYREVYYPLRLTQGDLSAIQEEFDCFERDIDSIIHTGRFEEWMKVLIAAEDYSSARQMLSRTHTAIERLSSGSITARFYTPQKLDWYAHKRQQFTKKAEKFLAQINRLEKKARLPVLKGKRRVPAGRRDQISRAADGAKFPDGAAVAEVVYDFTQRCFIGEKSEDPVDLSAEGFVFEWLLNGPVTTTEVHQLPPKHRQLLHALLTQYIMFLEINRGLSFSPDFLEGSSKERLGSPLLQYICEHRWPFPQMLQRA